MQPSSPAPRRATRSASSSALVPGVVTKAHVRRSSRIPSLSHSHSSPYFPQSPTSSASFSPSTKSARASLALPHRLASSLAALLRAHPSRIPHARLRLLAVFSLLFLLLFTLIFIPLRFFLGRAASPANSPHQINVDRVQKGLSPIEYWPSSDSLAHALAAPPTPVLKDVNLEHIKHLRSRRRKGSVTLVAACRDRTAFLQTALPGWLDAIRPQDDILLVDWGTRPPDHVPLEEVVRISAGPKVAVVTVKEPGQWVLSRAYNLAFALATGEWIFKVDCDTEVRQSFFDRHPLQRSAPQSSFFYRYDWRRAPDENQKHLSGVFLARADHIARIHGYDERITTYGWDDSDLYARLQANGTPEGDQLVAVDIQPATLSHMSHGDDLRSANQHLVMGPSMETELNSQAVSVLSSWQEVASTQKTVYTFDVFSRDARFITARAHSTPVPLLDQLSQDQRSSIMEEGTNRLLHDTYGFPWIVLSEINRSRSELARSLAALGKSLKSRSPSGLIFAEVGGSVPQRLLGMSSALALAIVHERPLFLAWSAGSREEPTPRITDFFDVDNSGFLLDDDLSISSRRKGARVYQIGRWKCRYSLDVCAQSDPAFETMVEFRTGSHDDETTAAQSVLDALNGKGSGKRNVLLRLEGAFPLQTPAERSRAFASLTPSSALASHINKLGIVSDHVGVYLGPGIRQRGIDAMVRRLQLHTGDDTLYFVSGAERSVVDVTRKILPSSSEVATAVEEPVLYGATEEIRDTTRDIAELYALSTCRDMVNDGRPPASVLEVLSLLKRRTSPRR
ncbi:Galactosyltransferase [Gracilaria domingensis]|nr:Galactosyltransferase [Gracilaria domingensis]